MKQEEKEATWYDVLQIRRAASLAGFHTTGRGSVCPYGGEGVERELEAGEVRSMLCFIERLPWGEDLKSQISDLKSLSESCSRQLRGWADHLQNTDIKGQRHLTAKYRKSYVAGRELPSFMQDPRFFWPERVFRKSRHWDAKKATPATRIILAPELRL